MRSVRCGAIERKTEKPRNYCRKAVGVRTIEQLLDAPLESVTIAAEEIGITVGMKGKEALLKMR